MRVLFSLLLGPQDKDKFGNDVTFLARPLPVEYLIIDVSIYTCWSCANCTVCFSLDSFIPKTFVGKCENQVTDMQSHTQIYKSFLQLSGLITLRILEMKLYK